MYIAGEVTEELHCGIVGQLTLHSFHPEFAEIISVHLYFPGFLKRRVPDVA